MPVHCKYSSGKYEVIDKSGKIHARHDTRAGCMRQARAINASKSVKASQICFSDDHLETKNTDNELVYIKELIYEGDFHKDDTQFSVDSELLEHWESTFKDFKEAGIEVPIPSEHSFEPSARLGTVTEMFIDKNQEGKDALYAECTFADNESAKVASRNQVSIFAPGEYKSGDGTEYTLPIQHVAVTSYPVIPKLEGFNPLVLSSIPKKEPDMALKDLAGKLKLELSNEAKDSDIEDLVLSTIQGLEDKVSELTKKIPADPKNVLKPNQAMLSMLKENRELKLSGLTTGDKPSITPACKKKLETIFMDDEVLGLMLSHDKQDNFDKVIDALKDNVALELGGKTGAQIVPKTADDDKTATLLTDLIDKDKE